MRINNLDLLRGFAALWVFTDHLQAYLGGALTPWPVFNGFFAQGWIGVDLFVVISGYVISMVIADWRRDSTRAANAEFAIYYGIRRFARIAPLHYLTASIIFT